MDAGLYQAEAAGEGLAEAFVLLGSVGICWISSWLADKMQVLRLRRFRGYAQDDKVVARTGKEHQDGLIARPDVLVAPVFLIASDD
jgi:hypothetical protein